MIHYTNACFPINPNDVGGLRSVLDAELREWSAAGESKDVVILAPDTEAQHNGNLEIRPINPLPAGAEDRWDIWFARGMCLINLIDAYTAPRATSEALADMYLFDKDRPSAHPIGSVERLLELVEATGEGAPNWDAAKIFCDRFADELGKIPAGAVLNLQSMFMEPLINSYSDSLRAQGVFQTLHLHEALPDSLHLSSWGRRLLQAMSKVDCVFVHTDTYKNRLELQMEMLNITPPQIKRFDLGIDQHLVRESLATITRSNFTSAIPGYWSDLNQGQRDFIAEVFRSQETVPNRFMCVCRVDPVKGIDVLIRGVTDFLRQRHASGEDIKQNYRFFFLQNGQTPGSEDVRNMNQQYSSHVQRLFDESMREFSGIIWRADALRNNQRIALPALMQGCHGITGGTTEGLNLAVMENIKSNDGYRAPTSVVVGSNAGYALRVIEQNNKELAYFPTPGQVGEFTSAFHRLVTEVQSNPSKVAGGRDKLAREIDSRHAKVLISPDEI